MFQIEWGVYVATAAYSRITLPSSYTVYYTPVTVTIRNNATIELVDCHQPCLVSNIQMSFFERNSFIQQPFYWNTVGY